LPANPYLEIGLQAARERFGPRELAVALRASLPRRFRDDGVRFTDGDIDAIYEAFDLIRGTKLSFEEAFGVDLLCTCVPIVWRLHHLYLASLWREREAGGDPDSRAVKELHERAARREVSVDDFWRLCPWALHG